jgi:hypothetical protein
MVNVLNCEVMSNKIFTYAVNSSKTNNGGDGGGGGGSDDL